MTHKICFYTGLLMLLCFSNTQAQPSSKATESKVAEVKHYSFVGDHREESMWSALYAAKSGKIYIGLCTHAEAAHLYEFDPATETMKHVVDLTKYHRERGKGINTNGKIHVRMGEDKQGRIYFAGLNEDTGPESIDPESYLGPFWYRYDPANDKVEDMGTINRHFGLLGMIMDTTYMRLYGLAEDGHLYMHDIGEDQTRDLGRVDDWDICRTIFADDNGNIYGSYPVGQIWKYDPVKDELIDFPNIRLKYDMRVMPRTMSKPMIDRKVIWRVIEWDPQQKVAYGIMGGSSTLFRYDVHDGPEGSIEYLTKLCAPQYWEEEDPDPRQIPFSTLALTISPFDHLIYYAPVASGSFDYIGNSWDVHQEEAFQAKLAGGYFPPVSYLVTYNPATNQRKSLGQMVTETGNMVFGLGGACTGQIDGKIYFVGAVEESDPAKEVGKVARRWPYSMGLVAYDPK